MASIMDAFMFLMAMVALGAFLFCEQDQAVGSDEEAQARVERSLAVLVSVTLEVPSSDGLRSDNPSIELLSLIQPTDVGNGYYLPQWAVPEVRGIITGLLGSGWSYEWSIDCDGSESILISDGCCPVVAEVFASRIECSTSSDVWILTLRAWRG
jgi:hypothetical protein